MNLAELAIYLRQRKGAIPMAKMRRIPLSKAAKRAGIISGIVSGVTTVKEVRELEKRAVAKIEGIKKVMAQQNPPALTDAQMDRLDKELPAGVAVNFGHFPVTNKGISATIRHANEALAKAKRRFPERFQ